MGQKQISNYRHKEDDPLSYKLFVGVARFHGCKLVHTYRAMDSEGLTQSLDFVGSSGVVLSVEKKACLETSLALVQQKHKFQKVKFWGVVKGIQKDYYIVQGIGKDEIRSRKSLYR